MIQIFLVIFKQLDNQIAGLEYSKRIVIDTRDRYLPK